MSKEVISFAKRLAGKGDLAGARKVLEVLVASEEATGGAYQYMLDVLAYQADITGTLDVYRQGFEAGFKRLALNQFYFNVVPKLEAGEALDNAIAALEKIVQRFPDAHAYTYLSLARLQAIAGDIDRAVISNQRVFDPAAPCSPVALRAPAFIVAGTVKGGTTSFYDYLALHPQIKPALFKEVRFFNNHDSYALGKTWYYSHFPQQDGFISGEATPGYFSSPTFPQRVHEIAPNAKIFICLRDPVARTISHHNMDVREGRSKDSLLEVLNKARQIIAGPDFPEKNIWQLPYSISDSFYIHHLANFLKYLPRDSLHIVQAERLLQEPQAVLDEACHFLALDPMTIDKPVMSNVGEYTTPSEEIAELREYLLPFSQGLDDMLGCRFSWLNH